MVHVDTGKQSQKRSCFVLYFYECLRHAPTLRKLRQRAHNLHDAIVSLGLEAQFSGENMSHTYTEMSHARVETTINSNTIRRLLDDEFQRSDAQYKFMIAALMPRLWSGEHLPR
jgi:hypothetical protein